MPRFYSCFWRWRSRSRKRSFYSLAFTSNLASSFTTFLAVALGLGAGMAILRLLRREDIVDV